MKITIDKTIKQALYKQIADEIKRCILTNQLMPNESLPPERKLADELCVNRTTVLNAYRQLKEEGLVEAKVGKGTVVAGLAHEKRRGNQYAKAPQWPYLQSGFARQLNNNTVREILEIANNPNLISFAAGIPSPEGDPITAIGGLENDIKEQENYQSLKMSPTEGFHYVREAMVDYLAEAVNIQCAIENVMIITGVQQGIDIAARLFLNPGDTVIVEKPSYLSALQIFSACGANIISVPVEDDGMDTEKLHEALRRYRPKFIYTMPTFQNPTGIQTSLVKRKRILELAYQYGVPIIEDDAYGQFNYEAESIPTLYQLDQHHYVIYLHSFSKMFFPGLRMGVLVASPAVVNQFSQIKQLTDLHTNSLAQHLVYRFITSGQWKQHVETVRTIYQAKRDAMCNDMPSSLSYCKPKGGFYIWAKLPKGINDQRLYHELANNGVTYVPGNVFFNDYSGREFLRLNFTYPDEESIKKGLNIINRIITEYREKIERSVSKDEILPLM